MVSDSLKPEQIRKRIYLDREMLIIFSITMTAIMSVSSIAPVFPKIMEQLNISAQSVSLLVSVFTLPGILLTPVFGVLADRFGRKLIVVPSLFLFGIAGGACAFTTDFNILLTLRFFQGIGAASLGSMNVTIIGDIYNDKERTAAMGYNSSVLSIGTTVYPAIGGALGFLGWHYPFFLAFLGIPVGLLVLFFLKNPEPKNRQKLSEYFKNLYISLKNRKVIGLFVSCGVTFIILYGSYLTYLPVYMTLKFESNTLINGLVMSVVSISTAVTASQLGKLIKRFSEQTLLKTSFLIYGFALAIMPLADEFWKLLGPTILIGYSHGTNIPVTLSLLAKYAPMEYRAAFMATNGMLLRLGQTIGPVLMGTMYLFGGINYAFWAGSALTAVMFVYLSIIYRK
ncbi:MFS transporter [candidate division KSB1 bacterium]